MRRQQRRTNLLWGVLLLAVALVLLLDALEVIPPGIHDILWRAVPALLLLAGLSVFLRDRVPYGSLAALVVSAALVGLVTAAAFSSRAARPGTGYRESVNQEVGADITLLEVSVETLSSDVEVLRILGDSRTITGEFVGSPESIVTVEYDEASDGRAFFRVVETRANQFPLLEAVGRGTLRLELPADLPLDMAFRGLDGQATFNMNQLALERLNLTLEKGDALVTLPQYNPLSPNVAEQPGRLIAREGSITVFVPAGAAARFELDRGPANLRPQFPDSLYFYLDGDILQARTYDSAEIKLHYRLIVPNGQIRVENAG